VVVTKRRILVGIGVILVAGFGIMVTRPAVGQHIFTDDSNASVLGEYQVLATPEPSTSPDPGPPSNYYTGTTSDYDAATPRTPVARQTPYPAATPYSTPAATPAATPLPSVEPTPWTSIKPTPIGCGGCLPRGQLQDANSLKCAQVYCAN
jgi:hypothetical protein